MWWFPSSSTSVWKVIGLQTLTSILNFQRIYGGRRSLKSWYLQNKFRKYDTDCGPESSKTTLQTLNPEDKFGNPQKIKIKKTHGSIQFKAVKFRNSKNWAPANPWNLLHVKGMWESEIHRHTTCLEPILELSHTCWSEPILELSLWKKPKELARRDCNEGVRHFKSRLCRRQLDHKRSRHKTSANLSFHELSSLANQSRNKIQNAWKSVMCLSKLAYSRRDFLSSSKEWRTTHSEEEEEKEEEEEENQNQQTNPHTQQNSTKNRTNPCLHFSFPSTKPKSHNIQERKKEWAQRQNLVSIPSRTKTTCISNESDNTQHIHFRVLKSVNFQFCQQWDSNPRPFGPVPETGALDQLGHIDTTAHGSDLLVFLSFQCSVSVSQMTKCK